MDPDSVFWETFSVSRLDRLPSSEGMDPDQAVPGEVEDLQTHQVAQL